VEIELEEGNHEYLVDFSIDDPVLWWPAEIGNPYLYNIEYEITSAGKIDSKSEKLGIRKVKVSHLDDEWGKSFFFSLNEIPVFAKGANYIPMLSQTS